MALDAEHAEEHERTAAILAPELAKEERERAAAIPTLELAEEECERAAAIPAPEPAGAAASFPSRSLLRDPRVRRRGLLQVGQDLGSRHALPRQRC